MCADDSATRGASPPLFTVKSWHEGCAAVKFARAMAAKRVTVGSAYPNDMSSFAAACRGDRGAPSGPKTSLLPLLMFICPLLLRRDPDFEVDRL